MADILDSIETPYVNAQTLVALFSRYRKPREVILRLANMGELIRLKNGFYLIADRINQKGNTLIPFEQVANLLYGPSYVSLEWALSFYGMIPEKVHAVTSMVLGRSKEYQTPIGDFLYYRSSESSYPWGITQLKTVGFIGGFLMAMPEKAICDLVYVHCKKLDKEQLRLELLESKRIDPESLQKLDKKLLREIGASYRTKSVAHLLDIVGTI